MVSHRLGLKPKAVLALVVLATIVAVAGALSFFPGRAVAVFLALLGVFLGIVVSMHLYDVFEAEDSFDPGLGDEEIILDTRMQQISRVTVPSREGGFTGEATFEANLYLTTDSIIAEPREFDERDEMEGLYVFQIPYESIISYSMERKLRSDYLRVIHRNERLESVEVLLFPGRDTGRWFEELQGILPEKAI